MVCRLNTDLYPYKRELILLENVTNQKQTISIRANFILLFVFILMNNVVLNSFRQIITNQKKLLFPTSLISASSEFFQSDFYAIFLVGVIVYMFAKRKAITSRFHNLSPALKRIAFYGTIGVLISSLLYVLLYLISVLPSVLSYVFTSKQYFLWLNQYYIFWENIYAKFLFFLTRDVPWFIPLLGIAVACIVNILRRILRNDYLEVKRDICV